MRHAVHDVASGIAVSRIGRKLRVRVTLKGREVAEVRSSAYRVLDGPWRTWSLAGSRTLTALRSELATRLRSATPRARERGPNRDLFAELDQHRVARMRATPAPPRPPAARPLGPTTAEVWCHALRVRGIPATIVDGEVHVVGVGAVAVPSAGTSPKNAAKRFIRDQTIVSIDALAQRVRMVLEGIDLRLVIDVSSRHRVELRRALGTLIDYAQPLLHAPGEGGATAFTRGVVAVIKAENSELGTRPAGEDEDDFDPVEEVSHELHSLAGTAGTAATVLHPGGPVGMPEPFDE